MKTKQSWYWSYSGGGNDANEVFDNQYDAISSAMTECDCDVGDTFYLMLEIEVVDAFMQDFKDFVDINKLPEDTRESINKYEGELKPIIVYSYRYTVTQKDFE